MPPPSNKPHRREDVDLRQVLRHLRPYAVALLLTTAAASTSVYLSSRARPPVFEATASILTVGEDTRNSALADVAVTAPPLPPGAVEEALHSYGLVEDIIVRLRGTALSPGDRAALAAGLRDELASRDFQLLTVRARTDQQQRGVYELVARAPAPVVARDLASVSMQALLAWDTERARRRFSRIGNHLEERLGVLNQQLQTQRAQSPDYQSLFSARERVFQNLWQAALLESAATGSLTLVAAPIVPRQSVAPRPLRDAALAGLLTLLGGAGLVLLIQGVRLRVRGAADLRPLGLPVLGELPRISWQAMREGIVPVTRSGSLQADVGFMRLRLAPVLSRANSARLVVCGAVAGQGTSSVVAALAENYGASGLRVLVIDARHDQTERQQLWLLAGATWYGLPGSQINPHTAAALGAATTLTQACLSPHLAQVARVSSHVDLLPAGDPWPGGVYPANFGHLLDSWSAGYDLVLIDAPPLLAVPDALTLAGATAGLLLVADTNRARLPDLECALALAETAATTIVGVVLTKVPLVRRVKKDTRTFSPDVLKVERS